jgi:hydroxyethylthiazole kinase-like uncharacterized protein yjeF
MKTPKHIKSIHKGQLGRVLVVGGSPKYYGAPILTGLSAEAAGADLIHIYTCHKHIEAIKKYSLNFFIESFPEHPGSLSLYDVKKIQQLEIDVIAIGNGMGHDFDAKKAMLAIINSDKPVMIDGDALVPELLKIYNPKKHKWILTPHHGEFQRVFGVDATTDNIEAIAREHSLNLCVKGKIDYIIACNDFKIDSYGLLENGHDINREMLLHSNNTGVNQMRVGGTGDALVGIISSYIAQGFSALQSMIVATHLFGLAGQALAVASVSFTARALIKSYPKYIAKHG